MKKKEVENKVAKDSTSNNLVIFQSASGAIELRGDIQKETVWATQAQIAELFMKDQSVISRHIKSILNEDEFNSKSNMQKMHIANSDKPVIMYSLDIILAVGYRTNSSKAVAFRQWANKILKDYLLQGYAINKKIIQKNYQQFTDAISNIQQLLPDHITLDPAIILELVKEFSFTWQSLDAYDKDLLVTDGASKPLTKISTQDLYESITSLKNDLLEKDQATDIFAQERVVGSLDGIVGNVTQSFYGQTVYTTAEEQAAHLLYFIVKNHPFVDGNKRTAAWSFIWFLRKAKIKGYKNINPSALTAITLLIAESKPEKKDQMIALVTNMLETKQK
jgi:death-on-curing family protein